MAEGRVDLFNKYFWLLEDIVVPDFLGKYVVGMKGQGHTEHNFSETAELGEKI